MDSEKIFSPNLAVISEKHFSFIYSPKDGFIILKISPD